MSPSSCGGVTSSSVCALTWAQNVAVSPGPSSPQLSASAVRPRSAAADTTTGGASRTGGVWHGIRGDRRASPRRLPERLLPHRDTLALPSSSRRGAVSPLPDPICVRGGPVLATIPSASLLGTTGIPVHVEVHIGNGLPGFRIVGQ